MGQFEVLKVSSKSNPHAVAGAMAGIKFVYAQVNDPDFPAGRQLAPEVKGRLIQLQYSWEALDNPMSQEEADRLAAQYFPAEPRA